MSAPASRASPIHATSVAKGTGRSRIAVASPAFTNCSKRSPTTHPNHAHLKEWAGDYDPDSFDELPIKYALGRIANPPQRCQGEPRQEEAFWLGCLTAAN